MKRGRHVGVSLLSSVSAGLLGLGLVMGAAGCGRLDFGDEARRGEPDPSKLKLAYQRPGSFHAVLRATSLQLAPEELSELEDLTVSPALPEGLVLDAKTGVISGVPTTLADRVPYTLTGRSFDGEISTTIYLTVLPGSKVDSTEDLSDVNLSDGKCGAANDRCTLRAAVETANVAAGKQLILLPAATLEVTGELRPIDRDLVLAGEGIGATVVRAQVQHSHRLMLVAGTRQVRVEKTTIRDFGADDGGVLMALDGSRIEAFNVELASSKAANFGGALYIKGAEATFEDTTFTDNLSAGRGGAIYGTGGRTKITVSKSTATGNRSGYGAFAHVDGDTEGGSALLVVLNSTMTQNVSMDSGTLASKGGHLEITNSTIVHNINEAAPAIAGSSGIYLLDPPASLVISNSIVAANTNMIGLRNCHRANPLSTILSKGGNVFSDDAQGCDKELVGQNDVMNADPMLLGSIPMNNGGATRTVEILPGSAAIDRGVSCPEEDQRGVKRDRSTCDAGAYERAQPPAAP